MLRKNVGDLFEIGIEDTYECVTDQSVKNLLVNIFEIDKLAQNEEIMTIRDFEFYCIKVIVNGVETILITTGNKYEKSFFNMI